VILAALAVLASAVQAARLRTGAATAVATALLIFAAGWEIRQNRSLEVLPYEQGERNYPEAAHWAQKNLPPNSVIFCMQVSGAFFYYSDFLLIRWGQIAPEKFGPLLTAVAGQQRPVYAALFAYETPEALEKIGGHWTRLTNLGQVTFWQRQP
jgi:hypothetical protein